MQARHLFGNENKYCEWCNRPLPKGYEGTLCAGCQENAFFREIRDYVRKHDVNEFELAEAFGIPLRRIKKRQERWKICTVCAAASRLHLAPFARNAAGRRRLAAAMRSRRKIRMPMSRSVSIIKTNCK